jgi:hypothetical protein
MRISDLPQAHRFVAARLTPAVRWASVTPNGQHQEGPDGTEGTEPAQRAGVGACIEQRLNCQDLFCLAH